MPLFSSIRNPNSDLRTLFSISVSDKRAMAFWVLAALISMMLVFRYHTEALPSASIDFKLTRVEAEQQAASFLTGQGYSPDTYRAVTTFGFDDEAKVYLEREFGLQKADSLMTSIVSVWRWDTRFFRPQQQEEFSVSLSPSGRLVDFSREVEEARDGAALPQDSARAIAEEFLVKTPRLLLTNYQLMEGQTTVHQNRTDHTFTWERIGFVAKEATYRISVTVQGDQIGAYSEFLKIPDSWRREYTHLRSRNQLSQAVANVGLIGLVILVAIVFFKELPKDRLRWRFGLQCGALLGVTSIALSLNLLPLSLTQYNTTQSLQGYYGELALITVITAGGWFLFVSFLTTVGGVGYREGNPDRLSPEWLFSGRATRSSEYITSGVVGYCIALVMLGYVTIFYMVGAKYGVWAPAGIDYTDLASTALPWLYPLSISLQASIFEEGLFRLFAIPFLKRYLKSTFLAVLIPAVCWGFLHSNYPQQPFFIRGLELTLVGVLLGYVFLRHGILATLIAHYVFDALVLSLFLFQSSRPYFQLAGALVVGAMLIPLLPSLIAWRRGYLINDPAILNRLVTEQIEEERAGEALSKTTTPVPEPPIEPTPFPASEGEPVRRSIMAMLWGTAVVCVLLALYLPAERFLDFLKLNVDRPTAIVIAETHLRQQQVAVDGFHTVASFSTAASSPNHRWGIRYLRENAGVAGLNAAYRDRLWPGGWIVRFYRPLEKEEYAVMVGIDGQIIGYDHTVEETAPGDTLSADAALIRAQASLTAAGKNLEPYYLVESQQERRIARTDHFFVWEDSLNPIGEGHFRLNATVQGDEVTQTRASFKPPEAWIRKEQERTFKDIVFLALGILLSGGVGALVVVMLVGRLRDGTIRWRFGFIMAVALASLSLLSRLNAFPSWYELYRTTESVEAFLLQFLLSNLIVGPALLTCMGVLLFSFVESAYRMVYPERPDLTRRFKSLFTCRTDGSMRVLVDAVGLSYAACLLLPSLRHLADKGVTLIAPNAAIASQALPPYVETASPVVAAIVSAVSTTILASSVILAVWLFVRHYSRKASWIPWVLLIMVAVYQADLTKTWMTFGTGTVRIFLTIGVLGLLMRYVWRDNLLAYGLTVFLVSLTGDGWAMVTGSAGVYRASGLLTIGVALIPAGALGVYLLRYPKPPTQHAAGRLRE